PTHALFEAGDEGWVCVVAPDWDGFVDGPTGRRAIATLAALVTPGADGLVRLPMGPDDQAVVHVGASIFVVRAVFPSKRVPVTGRDGIDYPLLGITGFMGVVTMMLGVALSVVQPPAKTSTVAEQRRIVDLLLQQPLDTPKPPSPAEGPAGERAKGKEGKRGEPDQHAEATRRPVPRPQRDRDIAIEAGVLGAIRDDAALNSVLGESGLPSALKDGVSALIGARSTQNGFRGLGERGAGFGGGGTAELSAGLSVRGRGPGADGFRPQGDGKKEGGAIRVDEGMITIGALDKALVDQVVKRNMAQIRYCYQRELTKNPSLGGKVTVKFVIAKDGSVSTASTKSSTLANAAVESCINGRFLRFQFPEPKGGGIVVVSYPFLFSPG
ncbi:MAG: AgmX/PglI C-terminal domain-containing protein, partial [Myxococcota bacterium]